VIVTTAGRRPPVPGATLYLQKPVALEDLLGAVARFITKAAS
jgi:hypothetical protein